jgi:hypothetical protein
MTNACGSIFMCLSPYKWAESAPSMVLQMFVEPRAQVLGFYAVSISSERAEGFRAWVYSYGQL